MRVSMVSLERRVPHASEAVVPLERGCTHPSRPAAVAWPGVSMAERSIPGCGGRRVERVRRCGGRERRVAPVVACCGRVWCAAHNAGARSVRPEPLHAGWLRTVMVGS
jgi:hypothetical protein